MPRSGECPCCLLLRAALFLVPGTALWAPLPLIASQRLAQGAGGYGLLLGALGAGAVLGAFLLPPIRAKLSTNAPVVSASVVYAPVLVVPVLVTNVAAIMVALVPAGIAWMAILSTVNAAIVDDIRRHLTAHLWTAETGGSAEYGVRVRVARDLQRDLLRVERHTILNLRDRGDINDETLRRIQRDLDLEEMRLGVES